jgi:pimeloyl-ACP methyl ester carboxylesterase
MLVLEIVLAVLLAVVVAAASFIYLAPESVTRFAINLARRRSGLVRKEIDVHGGLHFVYLEGGKGEPLMLLHGFGGFKDNFMAVAQSERLHTLALALGIDRLHLGGNSMGGQIALTYAARYPTQVASLWLLNPAGVSSAPKSELAKIIEMGGRNPLIVESEDDLARLFRFVMSEPPFMPRPMLKVLAHKRMLNAGLEKRIGKQIHGDSVEQRIAGLSTLTLIVWGDKDRVLDVQSPELLHQLMPKSQVAIMPGVGHLPMVERPLQSAEDYLRFRKSTGSPH